MYIILLYFAQASERIMEISEQYSDLTAINVNGSIYILKNIVWQLSATGPLLLLHRNKQVSERYLHPGLPILPNTQINNSILYSLKATTTQIYWQELFADKKYTILQ